MRLKPHAIDVRIDADPIHYFLGDSTDVRSSYYLEDRATEFQVQGLELDLHALPGTLISDVIGTNGAVMISGNQWQNIHSNENQRNLKNAYRVLLTRARQGMAIFVPPGSPEDPTRPPAYYDQTYTYLRALGLTQIPATN